MRQFAGFGSAADTNERYHFLMSQGQTGLSVAFDMPALMGRDADDPLSLGEVGRCGASVSSLRDMETLFNGIPLDDISVSMTISGPAATFFCYYLAVAEQQGVPFDQLDGTCQTDILKEYIAQKEWVYPPRPHLRLMGDMMEFCAEHTAEVPPDLGLRLPHPRSGIDGGAGARLHARRRLRVRRARPRSADSTSTCSAPSSRSSSTRTSTSSRRSRSSAPRAASGRGG